MNSKLGFVIPTGVLVGVETIEIVTLLAKLDASIASAKFFHEKRVVLLHYLPNQLPWNCRHLQISLHDNGNEHDVV